MRTLALALLLSLAATLAHGDTRSFPTTPEDEATLARLAQQSGASPDEVWRHRVRQLLDGLRTQLQQQEVQDLSRQLAAQPEAIKQQVRDLLEQEKAKGR